MMVWANIAGRITAGEGLTTEFKRTLEFRRLGRAVCGFANHEPGHGWLVMRKAMLEFNGTEPRLEEDALSRFVTVTLPLARP